MADIEALYSVFESFCQFGSTRDLSSIPSKAGSSQPQMDGSKFAKFSRDCDILDKQITPTEIDIVFNKVKSKTERKIMFPQFQEALKQISKKKYPSKAEGEAFVHLVRLVAHNGNPQVATLVKTPGKASASNITERLTDPLLFTGTQKVLFEARLKSPATKQKREYNSVLTPSQDRLDKTSSKPKKRESESPRFVTSKGLSASASSISSTGKASVFDRLTDTSKYTGTHKERFDKNGNGLGLAGRDPTILGGQVTSLAKILRN